MPALPAKSRALTLERAYVRDGGGYLLTRELFLEGGHLAAAVRDRGDHARSALAALPRRVGQIRCLGHLAHRSLERAVAAVAARAVVRVDGSAGGGLLGLLRVGLARSRDGRRERREGENDCAEH